MRGKLARLKFWLVGLVCLTAAASALAEDRALIVGVSKYPFLTENGEKANRDLPGPVHDAANMKQFLIDHLNYSESQIKVLTDVDANREDILESFRTWLIDGSGPGDRVMFYFSGHGLTARDTNGDEKADGARDDGLDELLAPHDISGDLARGGLSNVILDDEIGELLAGLSGRAVTFITDSCFSGTISRGANRLSAQTGYRSLTPRGPISTEVSDSQVRANKTEAKLIAVLPDDADVGGSQAVWTAATAAQLAWDRPDGLGGIFTSAFIEGANGAADRNGDGKVTPAELLVHLRKLSETYCATNEECKKFGLTPTLEPSAQSYLTLPLTVPLFGNNPDAMESTPAEVADEVFVNQDDFKLSVKIIEGNELKLGDEIKISVESSVTGQLYLFDQSSGGELQQIFPNKLARLAGKDGLIRATTPLRIPDETYQMAFTVDERGSGVLLAVVVAEDVDLSDLISRETGFDIVRNPQEFLGRLAQRLQTPRRDSDPNTPNGRHAWTYAKFDYEVK